MARVTFVKKARKSNKSLGIKKGESYYWWKFRFGGKHVSKTRPRPSKLTQSNFYSTLLQCQESVEDLIPDEYKTVEELESDIDNIKGDINSLADECQGSFDNMPEGLQQGDTGQLLENRVSELQDLESEFDSIDYSEPDEGTVAERVKEIMDEISGFNWSID